MVQKMSKRIQVPVSPKLDKALAEWKELSGESAASTCAYFLEECAPTLREMSKALRAAQEAPEKALAGYSSFLEKVVSQAKQQELDLKGKGKRK